MNSSARGSWNTCPPAQTPVLLHNDFYLHNVMFAADNSGKVVGVFDWEMSTLGDPMIDLGHRDRTIGASPTTRQS